MLSSLFEYLISLDVLPFYFVLVAVLVSPILIKYKIGEAREDQIKKLFEVYGKHNVKEIELIDRSPKESTKFKVKTLTNTEIITMVPGYKIENRQIF
ncbi:hypothetical protein [Bacillus sp. RO1]|uniref:hypothetical protein n=1 Tax=Bacillus sp. RO1 TaxID=2722703 RepID=UPI00145646F4|nr:hypothetical protein [Bacillus sp. RO1]NLP52155.1 hypothetical protein [Bacillus sp. RO1]